MKKLTAIALALLLCFSTFSVGAVEYAPTENSRYIRLGEVDDYTLVYDTENPIADESYTRVIGDYFFTACSEQLGLCLSDGEDIVPLESAYGTLIGDNEIESVATIINEHKKNGVEPFDKWIVTNGAPEVAVPATDPHEKFDTGSGKTYYLFGWIYGRNYACEENDYEMGEFRFKNGELTALFTEDAYVAVKEENNAAWYMTNGWLGTNTTSATLYNTSITGANSNKLYVPSGIKVRFTLVENMDGSLTLSYTPEVLDDSTEEPPSQDNPGGAVPPWGDWENNPPSVGSESSQPGIASNNPPTDAPTSAPTDAPTDAPTYAPTEEPTENSSSQPQTDPPEPPTTEPNSPGTDSTDKESEPTTSPSDPTMPTDAPVTDPTESQTPSENPTAKPSGTTEKVVIKLNIIAATLQAGKVIKLYATDENGNKVSVKFSSSNKKVAKVSKKGKVYALKRGVAKIKVKYKKKKAATCLINVVTSPKLSKDKINLKKGQTKIVKISGKAPCVKNTYKNTKIAKVKSSRKAKKLKILGKRRGTTKLTIKVNGVKLKLKVVVD